MNDYRTEEDFISEQKIPIDAYYGINSIRGRENFDISADKNDNILIKTMAWVKKACVSANLDSGNIDNNIASAIIGACDKLINGSYDNQFIVNPIQGGGGTSFNMNTNEVIANIALEILGHEKGDYDVIGPLAHVNMSQSTNDVYPTALNLALILKLGPLCDALYAVKNTFDVKSKEIGSVIKMGRTHLNAAAPISFGQSFDAYASVLLRDYERINAVMESLSVVPLGGTVIGTDYKTSPKYREYVIGHLKQISGINVTSCANLADGIQNVDNYTALSSALKICVLNLSKIASDLRFLGSDKKYGVGDITLAPRQLGSSIIEDKVNPVMAELINQVAFLVCGHDLTISMAANGGQLELNVFKPIIAYCLFKSIDITANALNKFNKYCLCDNIQYHPR